MTKTWPTTPDDSTALDADQVATVRVNDLGIGEILPRPLSEFADIVLARAAYSGAVTGAEWDSATNTLTLTFASGTTQAIVLQATSSELPTNAAQDDALIYENGSWRAEKVHGDNIASGTIQERNILDGQVTLRKLAVDARPQIVVGDVSRIYQHYEERNLLTTHSGDYALRLPVLFDQVALAVGDMVLVQGRTNDPNGTVYISQGSTTTAISDSQAFVDGFAVLTISAAASSYSVVTSGNLTGQLLWDVQSVHRMRGTNSLGIGVVKLDLLVTPDLENFPPAFSSERVYSIGDRFYYQNAVYECIATIIGQTPPNATYYRKLIDAASVSNGDIDARIADWAEAGNTDPIPDAKIPAADTGGIAANLVENFAKTNFPETEVPPTKLPTIQVTTSSGSTTFGYQGQTGARSALGLATDTIAGLLSPAFKGILDGLPDWIYNGSRAPKNRLPSDIVYGNALKGEWNSGHAYSAGDLVKATPTGPHATPRYFLAIRNNSNINPFQTNSDWLELGVHQSIGVRIRGLWNRANSYLPGDVVVHQDEMLLCTEARAANADTAPLYTHWDVFFHMGLDVTDDGTLQFTLWNEGSQLEYRAAAGARFLFNRGDWTARTYYPQNVVKHVGERYICKQQHTASTGNEPGSSTAVNWGNYWERW